MELAQLLGIGQHVVLWEVGAVLHAMFMGNTVLDDLASVRDLDFAAVANTRHFTDEPMHEAEEVISPWLAMAVTPRGAAGLRQLAREEGSDLQRHRATTWHQSRPVRRMPRRHRAIRTSGPRCRHSGSGWRSSSSTATS